MRYAPGAAIVDISHNVGPYDLRQAAYLLLSAYKHFPAGTVHILPVDVFYGDAPRILLAEKDGCFFIAPDNGVLSLAFGDDPGNTWLGYECSKPYIFNDWINGAGKIMEALQLGSGNLPFAQCDTRKAPWLLQHKPMSDGVECNVLCIDRFENVVLNITKPQFEEIVNGRPFSVKGLKTMEITSISNNYSDVPIGIPLCRFNISGFLEIALNHGSAAAYLGLGAFNAGIRYPVITIFF